MHPVAQFNITYAYSIVSRRRRRNRKGLCTPARFARDAQEGQKLVLHSNFLSDSCESCLASNQVSTKSRCLTITPRFTVICRDTDFRPNLRHLCLTRNGDRWIVSEDTHFRHRAMELLKFIRIGREFWKSGKIFLLLLSAREFPSFVPSFRINWSVKNATRSS